MTSDPEAGRDKGCRERRRGNGSHLPTGLGRGPCPCLPGLLAALLPSPGGGLRPRDTWNSVPLTLPSSPCFLPPGPGPHLIATATGRLSKGSVGSSPHLLARHQWCTCWGGGLVGPAGYLRPLESQPLESQPLERTFLDWCPLGSWPESLLLSLRGALSQG